MNGIIAIKRSQLPVNLDGAGRVVLPKALRDSLGLVAGEPLIAEQRDEEIVIRRREPAPGLQILRLRYAQPQDDFSSVSGVQAMAYIDRVILSEAKDLQ